jgi:hypothetical protein
VPEQAQPGTLLHQTNYTVGVEFPHDVAAVHLDRPARAVELQGHFIGRAALEYKVKNNHTATHEAIVPTCGALR